MQPGGSDSGSAGEHRPHLLCTKVCAHSCFCCCLVLLSATQPGSAMSSGLITYMCRNAQDNAVQAWKPFFSPTGDHITKLNVFTSFVEVFPFPHP